MVEKPAKDGKEKESEEEAMSTNPFKPPEITKAQLIALAKFLRREARKKNPNMKPD